MTPLLIFKSNKKYKPNNNSENIIFVITFNILYLVNKKLYKRLDIKDAKIP